MKLEINDKVKWKIPTSTAKRSGTIIMAQESAGWGMNEMNMA